MANPERGEVALTVGETEYTLCLTTNDLCALQKRTGMTYGQMVVQLGKIDIDAMRAMLFQALQRHHAKQFKTLDAAGLLIDEVPGGFLEMVEKFKDWALVNRKPEDEGSADPLDAQANGTGKPSTLKLAESA